MRYVLLLVALLIMSPHRAAADHIGVFSDYTGSSCELGAAGFTSTATVVHKYAVGATGSRFRLELPPGSSFFAFNTPFPIIGSVQSSASIMYGQCLNGSIPVGTILAVLTPGMLCVKPAVGFWNVTVSDCGLVEIAATGGPAYVAYIGPCDYYACQGIVPTDQKTWGAVKALYRE